MSDRGSGLGARGSDTGAESPSTPEPRTPGPGGRVGKLFVVATPIGNLGDLAPRAREVLSAVRLLLAEDTRHVRKLLNHFGISTPARSLHEHNEAREVPRLLADLATGAEFALLSDAGTPLVADPGFRLVRGCRERGIPVLAVPGPSAVTAALAVSGLPPVPFTFAGFLPPKAAARAAALAGLAVLPHTVVIFVSPHRLRPELESCAEALGAGREAVLLAELTKVHERANRGTLGELAAAAAGEAKGEHTLVVGPPPPAAVPSATAEAAALALEEALARGLDLADARRQAARALGISRRELYDLLMPHPAR